MFYNTPFILDKIILAARADLNLLCCGKLLSKSTIVQLSPSTRKLLGIICIIIRSEIQQKRTNCDVFLDINVKGKKVAPYPSEV